MHLQELHLKNFRCFSDATIPFDKRLTVFVGKNGSGKTAILDAVAFFLSQIVALYLDERHDKLFALNASADKTISSAENMQLALDVISDNKKITLVEPEQRETIAVIIGTNGSVGGIDYNAVSLHSKENPTVISYYTTSRLSLPAAEAESCTDKQGCKAAYHSCFNPGLSWGATMNWIDRHDAQEAREFRSGNKDFRDPELNAMREAVEKALPGFDTLSFNSLNNEITVRRTADGQILSFRQLSDGYRAMLALILDLARRMALANGERYTQEGRSILESPAIVLIDEIELHLHPGWQQTVLPSLLNIFPNTQFIVSTHSPQVLSSIEPQYIRLLADGQCLPYTGSTYGAESSRILEEVFGIDLRAHTEAKQALEEYFQLIHDGEYDSPRARELHNSLEKWMYGDPALDTASMMIRRAERQKAREAGRA